MDPISRSTGDGIADAFSLYMVGRDCPKVSAQVFRLALSVYGSLSEQSVREPLPQGQQPRRQTRLLDQAQLARAARRPQHSIAEFWLILFTRDQEPLVFKRECALDELDIAPDRPALRGHDFVFQCESKNGSPSTGQSQGAIAGASWDLAITGGLPPLLHFAHQRLYTAPLPKKKILTPAPSYNSKFANVTVQAGDVLHTSSNGELEILTPEPLANVQLHPDPSWDGSEDYRSVSP